MGFDQWYEELLGWLIKLGFGELPPDYATAHFDYEMNISPKESAELFVKEFESK